MKMRLALVLLACLPAMTLAQSLVCSNKVVGFGTTQAEVSALCGNPAQVDHKTIYNTVGTDTGNGFAQRTGDIQVDIWTYNFGPNKLMQRIRFEDGRVVEIKSLGYGF